MSPLLCTVKVVPGTGGVLRLPQVNSLRGTSDRSTAFFHQGTSHSLLIELGGVSVVRVKRFRGNASEEDVTEQDTYCSVAGKTSQQEKVTAGRQFTLSSCF